MPQVAVQNVSTPSVTCLLNPLYRTMFLLDNTTLMLSCLSSVVVKGPWNQ